MTHWGDLVARKSDELGPVVIGVDPVWSDIPNVFRGAQRPVGEVLWSYTECLLDAAKGETGFVKFQSAFFEAFGLIGHEVLARGVALAKSHDIAIIMDAKRGDIGSTAAAYAKAFITPESTGGAAEFESDCLTVNPFLGPDSLEPFLDTAKQHDKGLFVLVQTSNPGSAWLQEQRLENGRTVSETAALLVGEMGAQSVGVSGLSAVGAVIGATNSPSAKSLRDLMPNAVILCPGLGPQGGSADNVRALARKDGSGVLAPVSRGVTKVSDLNISLADYRAHIKERLQFYRREMAD